MLKRIVVVVLSVCLSCSDFGDYWQLYELTRIDDFKTFYCATFLFRAVYTELSVQHRILAYVPCCHKSKRVIAARSSLALCCAVFGVSCGNCMYW